MKIKIMDPVILMTMTIVILTTAMLHASNMDKRIESSAKKSYIFETYLKNDAVNVQSKEGVVTLTGTVAEESHKSLAQETVAGLPGVTRVDNQLKIKAGLDTENTDGWLAMKVKTTLFLNRHVSLAKTEITVKDGVVTLRGEAANEAQKELTAEYAKDIEGVKEVKNEMTVAKTTKRTDTDKVVNKIIDDASITAQVKLTLLYHRSTSALSTKVVTNNGLVTLSGQARNPAEKELVSKLVTDITGVKSVNNQMTIEETKTK